MENTLNTRGMEWVSELVGALSPVNHERLHQGWKQTSVHLLLIPRKSDETAKFFMSYKISIDTSMKQKIQTQILEDIL